MKSMYLAGAVAVLLSAAVSSCTKSDDYKEFLESGPQIYPAKIDSLKVSTGRYRAGLSWIISSDPSVVKARIYWNNRSDSMDVAIDAAQRPDTVKAIVAGLEEKPYTFEVFTFNKQGNRSIGVSASGRALGERYEEALLNWSVVHKQIIPAAPPYSSALVVWSPFYLDGIVGVSATYTDADGNQQTKVLPADAAASATSLSFVFEKFTPGGTLTYTTLYLPQKQALDTLSAAPETITIP